MKINNSEFVISNTNVAKCPAVDAPEYAFIGRSNVGKSSLINMLTQHKKLAQTSSMPGKTMLINHFIINNSWYIVDLPGYGYAKRGKEQQKALKKIIFDYIEKRKQLTCLFILIDSRHEAQNIDLEFIREMGKREIPFAIIFTKSDKQSNGATQKNVSGFLKTLSKEWEELPPHFVTSSLKQEGRDEILDYIDSINQQIG